MRIIRIINSVHFSLPAWAVQKCFCCKNSEGNILNRIPLIRAVYVKFIKTDIEDFNFNTDSLFEKTKIPINCFEYPEALIPLESALNLYDLAAQRIGDISLGLKIGTKIRFEDLGDFGKLFTSCLNLKDLINKIEKYGHIFTNGTRFWHTFRGDKVHWFFSIHPDIKGHRRQTIELSIAYMQNAIKMAAGENWTATEVHFEHTPWDGKQDLRRVFNTSLRFSENYSCLVFPKKLMCLPIKEKNPAIENINSDLLKNGPNENLSVVLKQVLKTLSLEGRPKMSEVSMIIDVGPRTIHRRLVKEGTNFRELVDLVCFERSVDLLAQGNKNLLQIALMQGYSEGGSFGRAFKRWAGVTPSEYRSLSDEGQIH